MPLNPPQAYRKTEFTHRIGLAADRPLATNVLTGTIYFSTDSLVLERSNGTIWEDYSGSVAPVTSGNGVMGYILDSADSITIDEGRFWLVIGHAAIDGHLELEGRMVSIPEL